MAVVMVLHGLFESISGKETEGKQREKRYPGVVWLDSGGLRLVEAVREVLRLQHFGRTKFEALFTTVLELGSVLMEDTGHC